MMYEVWHFLTVTGALLGVGAMGVVILMIFAPSFVSVIAEYLKALSPLVRGLADGVVWFAKSIWSGFTDMMDNAASIIFVITVILLTSWYVHTPCPKQRAGFVSGRVTEKSVAPPKEKGKPSFTVPFLGSSKSAPKRKVEDPTPKDLFLKQWRGED